MLIKRLQKKGLIHPPSFLPDNTQYLVMMGSEAYGCSSGKSDMDLYGFCVPPKEIAFPHLAGEIFGFGRQKKRFEQWQQHHIDDHEAGKQYDFSVYNIIKYFDLVMTGNPNMVDSLFVPARCVLHCTAIGNIVRDNKRLFLHKGVWHKFKGYAYSQLHKIETKNHEGLPELLAFEEDHGIPHTMTLEDARSVLDDVTCHDRLRGLPQELRLQYKRMYETMVGKGKRSERVKIHGYDLKFSYHVVRLIEEVEQILTEHDLDLERNREQLKAIRRGEWTKEQIKDFFTQKEKDLEEVYHKSTLPHKPDEGAIKKVLLECLEHHYGSLDKAVVTEDAITEAFRQITEVVDKHRGLLG